MYYEQIIPLTSESYVVYNYQLSFNSDKLWEIFLISLNFLEDKIDLDVLINEADRRLDTFLNE